MSDLIREALENLVRQQDGHPRSLEKLRRQGLSPDHPTVTATMEGHRLMMDRAWQQAREAISRTPYPSTRQQEVGNFTDLVLAYGRACMDWANGASGTDEASVQIDFDAMRETRNRLLAAAPSTPEKAGGVSDGVGGNDGVAIPLKESDRG